MCARRSADDRMRVVTLAKEGWKASRIVRDTKLPKDFVIYWMHRDTPNGSVVPTDPDELAERWLLVTPTIRNMLRNNPGRSIRLVTDKLRARSAVLSKSTVWKVARLT